MGWVAITRDGRLLREINEDGSPSGQGRPVQMGLDNELRVVAADEYGHSVAVDLDSGVIAIDYTRLAIQNGTVEIDGTKAYLWICEETNIVGEYKERITTDPDEIGNYLIDYKPIIWRPIWFNRMISTLPGAVVVIGAQTTLPKDLGGHNIQKMVSLFPDGRVGIA